MENISILEPAADPKATLNIYFSDSTTENCLRSVAYAHQRSDSGDDVILYLNTGQTERQLHSVLREATGGAVTRDGNPALSIMTSPLGEIAFKREAIAEEIRRRRITHIIINSWEFAAKDARARNILIHTLLYFIDVFDVSVTICAQQGEGSMRGHISRGKLGRVSAFADNILPLKDLPLAENIETQKAETSEREVVIPEVEEVKAPEREVVIPEVEEPEEAALPHPAANIIQAEIREPEITEPTSATPETQTPIPATRVTRPALRHSEPVAVMRIRRDKNAPPATEMRNGKLYRGPWEMETMYKDKYGNTRYKTEIIRSNVEV